MTKKYSKSFKAKVQISIYEGFVSQLTEEIDILNQKEAELKNKQQVDTTAAEEMSIEQLYDAALKGDKEAAAKAFRMFRSKEYRDNDKAMEMRNIMRRR